ncbi:DNA-binding protein [Candidatus Marsarchaeota G2 archaeon OSP_D]|uniref:Transcription elongation factor Spt4 n=7 Tax=Candidatus Marsarchaeota group 2 TaxID=2203771 RepID=A0A2R6CEM9_9ARCH|nr:MAG: DNA-binding protein [Candidatus Marsarchaeota G2 archaeon ECH_B_SAG-M15]PSN92677.1 MAG: DNA-binding protein [Candidatus Marsarchaeota G2 archaeon OSP_D]PSN96775.1 MAG: DNA-binding protein [Candidatus Marsarchaeota G2 archaeon ECH_B_2]PSN97457.1 MAG: DNA-binding protein [Candidatus Marsarchaeota G2 archaeon ECH_B_SAG-C16]PSO01344.1 MAG: DNA-binding protein [Candidatus Marsarchaeota G2 archaeon ECH_B_3]PSO03476.1 MAG: DNA-binding protein [Candidatus Marsarchaeota G2 archaeon ECH_B_1]PSO
MPAKSSTLKACKVCKFLNPIKAVVCENCGAQKFSEAWSGLIIIYDPNNSQIARTLSITKRGKYALELY